MNTVRWNSVPLDSEFIKGAFSLDQTTTGVVPHRLPAWALRQANDPQISMMESQPSGVRIAFRTTATEIELTLLRYRSTYAGMPERAAGVVVLTVDGTVSDSRTTSGGSLTTIDLGTGQPTVESGPEFSTRFTGLPAEEKRIEIWLPHNETVEIRHIAANASIQAAHEQPRRVWVHHGSSISHGSNATQPTDVWPVAVSRRANVDLRNLGFGGSALLDQFMARTIRDLPANVISLKVGINVVNLDVMRLRAFRAAVHGFLDTIRDGHPETPILLISPIHASIHETTPGPGAFDLEAIAEGRVQFRATGDSAEVAAGKLTLISIRSELERIVAERREADANLHYLNGLDLFGAPDELDHPLPDGLHPDTASHLLIADRFTNRVFGVGGPFAG